MVMRDRERWRVDGAEAIDDDSNPSFQPDPHVAASTLTISIVTYRPDLALLDRTLHTLAG
jgi:hypothetical protein